MKFVIFLMNLFSVVFAVFVASLFIITGIFLSIGGPNYPYEPFYIDFFLLFLHIFYIIFLVIGVIYSLNYYRKDLKKGFLFALLPYIYILFLIIIYSKNG